MEKEFQNLLEQIQVAYEKSDIKKYAIKENKEWYYSLFGSNPYIKNPILLVGLNFGASNEDFEAQTIEGINLLKPFSEMDGNDLGKAFLRLKNYISNYDEIDIKDIVWTNYCFFRSYGREDLNIIKNDFQLTNEIFMQLINIIKPKSIICLSKDLQFYLEEKELLENEVSQTIEKINSRNDYTVLKAKLNNYDFYCLPHPNYPTKKEQRTKAWDFCFKS